MFRDYFIHSHPSTPPYTEAMSHFLFWSSCDARCANIARVAAEF